MRRLKRKICGIIYKLNLFFIKKRYSPEKYRSGKILIAANMGLGNMLFFTPVIRNLRINFPEVQIFLLKGENQPLEDLFQSDFRNISSINFDNPGIYQLYKLIKFFRHQEFAMALCNFISSTFYLNFILSFLKIPLIIGHGSSIEYFNIYDRLFDIIVPVQKSEHEIDRNLNLLKYAEISISEEKMFLPIDDNALTEIKNLMEKYDLNDNNMLIGLAPGSNAAGWWKRWDKYKFVELTKKLSKKFPNSTFIILGGSDDLEVGNFIINEVKNQNVLSFVNKTNIKQLVALLSRCHLLIGNDTGPVHIASALEIPAICLWGPSFIQRAHLRHEKGINIWKKVHCSPCYTDAGPAKVLECKDRFCLSTIEVDEVLSAAEKLLS